MGYTTDFTGSVSIEPALSVAEIAYLIEFAGSRRMNRTKGPLYVNPGSDFGQDHEADVTDYNRPHPDQPGLWCQWVPVDNGTAIEWDGGEKFYESAEWMKYLVTNLLAPSARAYIDKHIDEDPRLKAFTCDHVVNGTIEAQGEDANDRWALVVTDNVVAVAGATVTFDAPQPI